jgi:hypothetical protein
MRREWDQSAGFIIDGVLAGNRLSEDRARRHRKLP